MKYFRNIIRILLGLTFMFSGFVKGIDPLGSTYKFIDYFTAFGTEWANTLAFALAIILSIAEFAIGAALLMNFRTRLFSWLALIFMGFFLILTLYSALENPVSDCGCFGDAIILSNWNTFYKNIVLTAMAVFIVIVRTRFRNKTEFVFQNLSFAFILLVFISLQLHSYYHLPICDFRPYKIGNNIPELMIIPENAPTDEYKTEFIYRNIKSGKEKTFNEKNYPWQDTLNWEFVDATSVLVKKGYTPPIHDFSIENEYGEDISDFYLNDDEYTFILVSYNLSKANYRNRINKLADDAIDEGMYFIGLTSSTSQQIEKFAKKNDHTFDFYACDEITLKTIIRSNPGLVLTRKGIILDKWHRNDIPKFDKIDFDEYDKKFRKFSKNK